MVNLLTQNGKVSYNISEYVVDTTIELQDIPNYVGIGSMALVLEDSTVYIKNSNGQWISFFQSGAGGGSVEVDTELLLNSENPVSNGVITAAIQDLQNKYDIVYERISNI